MQPEEFFDTMFNYFNSTCDKWYSMLMTPKDWGTTQGANVPMGYEFDILYDSISDKKVSIEVPDSMWKPSAQSVDTCSPHGVGKILPISNTKCIGHNHPNCATMVNNTPTNELPTATDIMGIVNVARVLGSSWSFVISSTGLACYWTQSKNIDFGPEEYDDVALQGLSSGDLSEATEYLKVHGISIKVYYWSRI
jgi:hypothetical protein